MSNATRRIGASALSVALLACGHSAPVTFPVPPAEEFAVAPPAILRYVAGWPNEKVITIADSTDSCPDDMDPWFPKLMNRYPQQMKEAVRDCARRSDHPVPLPADLGNDKVQVLRSSSRDPSTGLPVYPVIYVSRAGFSADRRFAVVYAWNTCGPAMCGEGDALWFEYTMNGWEFLESWVVAQS